MRRRLILILALIIVVPFIGCRRPGEEEPKIEQEATLEEIEQLLALGYLDYSPEVATKKAPATVLNPEEVYPGYTLYVVRGLCQANLIDLEGTVRNTWKVEPCKYWSNAELFRSGDLAVTDGNGKLLWFSWNGNLKWKKRLRAHHDQEVLPDGRIAVLTRDFRMTPEISTTHEVDDSVITVLDRKQKIAGTLSLYDALSENTIGFKFLDRLVVKRRVDLLHANSVEWVVPQPGWDTRPGSVYESGNVLVSVRHQDTIIVVNWPRRELVWAWGQGIISAPHDASLLSNGNILLFDNGVGRKRSRVVEVNPVSREIEWEYDGGPAGRFYSAARGSAQRLPNGNTMVAVSDSGYGFEVTADGKVVWEFWNPILNENRHRATIIRAKRYEAKMVERLLE